MAHLTKEVMAERNCYTINIAIRRMIDPIDEIMEIDDLSQFL